MQKKGFIAVLSAIVLMIIASVSLVFAVGSKVSAIKTNGGGEFVLNNANDFVIDNDVTYEKYTVRGFSEDTISFLENRLENYPDTEIKVEMNIKDSYVNRDYSWSAITEINPMNHWLPYYYLWDEYNENLIRRVTGSITSIKMGSSSVDTIADDAFYLGFENVQVLQLPRCIRTIGANAFRDCRNLTTINVIRTSLTSSERNIGSYAFAGCGFTALPTSLFSDVDSYVTISDHAFAECYDMVTVNLNSNVESIGDYAFANCTGLMTVTIDGTPTIGEHIFDGCGYLTAINVTSAELYNHENLAEYKAQGILHYMQAVTINDGSNTTVEYVEYGDTITQPDDPVRTGYEFKGWYADAEYTQEFDFNAPIISDTEIYAKMIKKTYTVTFDTLGGNLIDPQTVTYGDYAIEPPAPEKANATFINWYSDSDYLYRFKFTDREITADTIIYAKWQYMLIVNYQDGVTANRSIDVIHGQTVKNYNFNVNPTREDYIFDGWYVDPDCQTPYDMDEVITHNITIYAKWNEAPTYTVTFIINDMESSQLVKQGKTVTLPDVPVTPGLTFIGWYTDNGNGVKFEATDLITSDLTLKAVWGVNRFTVVFVDNGNEINRQYVSVNGKVIKPSNPTQDGYVFIGWYTNEALDVAYNFDDTVTDNLTLYAKWVEDVPVEDEPQTKVNGNNNLSIAAIAGGVGAAVVCASGIILTIVLKKRRKL
ncbi:MAG: InlB B-repeat-containing protein [Clostridia bacterium]|nr:InlB B-repeat-containing protein [Clostridia bacterium]